MNLEFWTQIVALSNFWTKARLKTRSEKPLLSEVCFDHYVDLTILNFQVGRQTKVETHSLLSLLWPYIFSSHNIDDARMRLRFTFQGIDKPTSIALGTAMCFNKSVNRFLVSASKLLFLKITLLVSHMALHQVLASKNWTWLSVRVTLGGNNSSRVLSSSGCKLSDEQATCLIKALQITAPFTNSILGIIDAGRHLLPSFPSGSVRERQAIKVVSRRRKFWNDLTGDCAVQSQVIKVSWLFWKSSWRR